MSFKDKLRSIGYIKLMSVAVLVAVIAVLSVIGSKASDNSEAARKVSSGTSTSSIYMTPASAKVPSGSSFEVKLYANSQTDPVNVVQMHVSYPASQLKLDRIAEGVAFPIVAATDTSTPGVIRLARTVASGADGVAGTQVVATLHFTALPGARGSVPITYDTAGTLVMRVSDNTNLVTSSAGSNINIR